MRKDAKNFGAKVHSKNNSWCRFPPYTSHILRKKGKQRRLKHSRLSSQQTSAKRCVKIFQSFLLTIPNCSLDKFLKNYTEGNPLCRFSFLCYSSFCFILLNAVFNFRFTDVGFLTFLCES